MLLDPTVQNPITALLANALLFWLLLKLFRVEVGKGLMERQARSLRNTVIIMLATAVIIVAAGYFIGQATEAMGISSRWGYLVTLLLTIPAWYLLGVPLNRYVIGALAAIIISSVVSAAMGAHAWAIIFPGWVLGDFVGCRYPPNGLHRYQLFCARIRKASKLR